MNINGYVIPRKSCLPLTRAELNNTAAKIMRETFDKVILEKCGDSMSIPEHVPQPMDIKMEDLVNDADETLKPLEEDPIDTDGRNVFENPVNDVVIYTE